MKFPQQYLEIYSLQNRDRIIKWVGASPDRFRLLVAVVTGEDPLLASRAAWSLTYVVENNPALIKSHFNKLLRRMEEPGWPDGVRRNIIRSLEFVDLPRQWEGLVMNTCFRFLTDPMEKAAVKASCITILAKLARKFPEIKPELQLVVQDQWDREGAAFRSRAKKEKLVKA